MFTWKNILLGLAIIVGASSLACGDDSGSSSSSSSFSCCINGSYYSCDSSDAVSMCGDGDTSGCSRDSSKDDTCN